MPKAAIPIGATLAFSGPQALPIAGVYVISSCATESAGSFLPDNAVGYFLKHSLNIAGSCITGQYFFEGGIVYHLASNVSSYAASGGVNQLIDYGLDQLNVTSKWGRAAAKTAGSLGTSYAAARVVQYIVKPNEVTPAAPIEPGKVQPNEVTPAAQIEPGKVQPNEVTPAAPIEHGKVQPNEVTPAASIEPGKVNPIKYAKEGQIVIKCEDGLKGTLEKCTAYSRPDADRVHKEYVECLEKASANTVFKPVLAANTESEITEKVLKMFREQAPHCNQPEYHAECDTLTKTFDEIHYTEVFSNCGYQCLPSIQKVLSKASPQEEEQLLKTATQSGACIEIPNLCRPSRYCKYNLDTKKELTVQQQEVKNCIIKKGNPPVAVKKPYGTVSDWLESLEEFHADCYKPNTNDKGNRQWRLKTEL